METQICRFLYRFTNSHTQLICTHCLLTANGNQNKNKKKNKHCNDLNVNKIRITCSNLERNARSNDKLCLGNPMFFAKIAMVIPTVRNVPFVRSYFLWANSPNCSALPFACVETKTRKNWINIFSVTSCNHIMHNTTELGNVPFATDAYCVISESTWFDSPVENCDDSKRLKMVFPTKLSMDNIKREWYGRYAPRFHHPPIVNIFRLNPYRILILYSFGSVAGHVRIWSW